VTLLPLGQSYSSSRVSVDKVDFSRFLISLILGVLGMCSCVSLEATQLMDKLQTKSRILIPYARVRFIIGLTVYNYIQGGPKTAHFHLLDVKLI